MARRNTEREMYGPGRGRGKGQMWGKRAGRSEIYGLGSPPCKSAAAALSYSTFDVSTICDCVCTNEVTLGSKTLPEKKFRRKEIVSAYVLLFIVKDPWIW